MQPQTASVRAITKENQQIGVVVWTAIRVYCAANVGDWRASVGDWTAIVQDWPVSGEL